jgi:hypothetical protein
MSTQKYTLTLDEEQANVLSQACELLSRIYMGQLNSIADCFVTMDGIKYSELGDKLRELVPLVTGVPNGFYAIHSKKLPDTARVAWDLHQVIRHRVSHDRADRDGIPNDFKHRMFINYDEPMSCGDKPLAEMKKVE